MTRQTIRQRHYLANGVIRPVRWEVPPELEPEETERELLYWPPPPVGMEKPASLWTLLWVVVGLGALILMVI